MAPFNGHNAKRLISIAAFQNFLFYLVNSKRNKAAVWLKIHTEYSADSEGQSGKFSRNYDDQSFEEKESMTGSLQRHK